MDKIYIVWVGYDDHPEIGGVFTDKAKAIAYKEKYEKERWGLGETVELQEIEANTPNRPVVTPGSISEPGEIPIAPIKYSEFQKLTPEQQVEFWDKNWPRWRGKTPPPPKEQEAFFNMQEKNRCCKTRDLLIRQLSDEEDGVAFYTGIAGDLSETGEDMLADVTNKIADTEFEHYLTLRGIIDVLTEGCGCERKYIGPPFGHV
jgi:hypothetical protein